MKILSFKTSADFRRWLGKNHATVDGLWLRFFKKASGKKAMNYAGALDAAIAGLS